MRTYGGRDVFSKLNYYLLPSCVIHVTQYNEALNGACPRYSGGKTGNTDAAKEAMTAFFEVPVKNASTTATIAIVVLGSSDRKADVEKLHAWFKASARVEE